jgi:REP element-mobilizing transposase RayT
MVRGLERRVIFTDETDREDFLARVAALAEQGSWTVYAWALLPNHAHLLVRTGTRPLPRCMRSLLTGYAGAFNRRHKRIGHLFQNRYKSIVVEEEPYLLELVRYLHLNPLRAKVVPDLRRLTRYPWTGHSALLGTVSRPWQDTQTILAQFGPTVPRARTAYQAFLAAGRPQGRRPELQGGGLLRSQGGWRGVTELRRGREAYQGDARILGSTEFVAQLQRAAEPATPRPRARPLAVLVARVCRAVGIAPSALPGPGRGARVSRARAGVAYLWCRVAGQSGRGLATAWACSHQAISAAARRGEALATLWDPLWR